MPVNLRELLPTFDAAWIVNILMAALFLKIITLLKSVPGLMDGAVALLQQHSETQAKETERLAARYRTSESARLYERWEADTFTRLARYAGIIGVLYAAWGWLEGPLILSIVNTLFAVCMIGVGAAVTSSFRPARMADRQLWRESIPEEAKSGNGLEVSG